MLSFQKACFVLVFLSLIAGPGRAGSVGSAAIRACASVVPPTGGALADTALALFAGNPGISLPAPGSTLAICLNGTLQLQLASATCPDLLRAVVAPDRKRAWSLFDLAPYLAHLGTSALPDELEVTVIPTEN